MSFTLGLDGRTYWNNLTTYTPPGTGTEDNPNWVELGNQQDVTLSLNANESDVTVRGGLGWAMYAATLYDAEFSWGMVYDANEQGFSRIKERFFARKPIHLAFYDGDILADPSGDPEDDGDREGVVAWCIIRDFGRNEELSEAMKTDIVARPTFYVDAGGGIVAPYWDALTAPYTQPTAQVAEAALQKAAAAKQARQDQIKIQVEQLKKAQKRKSPGVGLAAAAAKK